MSLVALSGSAFAGRPLATEDASVLEEKRCQVEAWIDRARTASESWLAPACNFGGGIEWEAGFARGRESGRSFDTQSYAQVKGLLRELDDASTWGLAWVAGISRDALRESRRGWQDPYALLAVSVQSGTVLLHSNIGWTRDRARRRDIALWGVATEVAAGERITWVGEAFGAGSEKPFLRGGARLSVVKDTVEVDLTVVNRPGGTRQERYISLGVFWLSGRFLP